MGWLFRSDLTVLKFAATISGSPPSVFKDRTPRLADQAT
jgi:hypothetical protein